MRTRKMKRWITCLALGLVLGAATPKTAVIRSLHLEDTAAGATIELVTTAELRWTAGYSKEGTLVIRIDDSRPARKLPREFQGRELISSITIASDEGSLSPQTLLLIQTRAEASYSVKTSDSNLVVTMSKRPAWWSMKWSWWSTARKELPSGSAMPDTDSAPWSDALTCWMRPADRPRRSPCRLRKRPCAIARALPGRSTNPSSSWRGDIDCETSPSTTSPTGPTAPFYT